MHGRAAAIINREIAKLPHRAMTEFQYTSSIWDEPIYLISVVSSQYTSYAKFGYVRNIAKQSNTW